MSNSQLNKLKLVIKNGTEVTLKPSSNIVGDSNDENSFPHKLLLTNTQVSQLPKAFENVSSVDIKLSKTQLHKIEQAGGFSGNVLKLLTKNVLIPLRLTTASSATDATIHKKMFGSGCHSDLPLRIITLIISNEEMDDITKMFKSLDESGSLIKGVRKTTKNEAK